MTVSLSSWGTKVYQNKVRYVTQKVLISLPPRVAWEEKNQTFRRILRVIVKKEM